MKQSYLKGLPVLVIFVIALSSFILNGTHSRIISDDYCSAAIGVEEGIWGGMLYWYEGWSGRYSSFLLQSAMAPFQPEIHPYLTGVLIIGLGASLAFALLQAARLLNLARGLWLAVLLSSLVVFATVNSAPGRQTLYWLAAIIPYGLPLIYVLGCLGTLLWLLRSPHRPLVFWATGILLTLAVFIIGGFSETYTTFQVTLYTFVMAGAWIFLPRQRRRFMPLLLLLWLASLAALLLVVIAPGNAVRQAEILADRQMDGNPSLPLLAGYVALSTARLFFLDTFGLAHGLFVALLSTAGVLHLFHSEQAPALLPRTRLHLWALAGFALSFVLAASVVTPSLYSSLDTPARILFLPRFIQMACFAFAGYLAGLALLRYAGLAALRTRPAYRFLRRMLPLLALFMGLAALLTNLAELDEFSLYSQSWDARHASIEAAAAAGASRITIAELPYYLDIYLMLDRYDLPTEFSSCGTRFYGLERIFVEADQ